MKENLENKIQADMSFDHFIRLGDPYDATQDTERSPFTTLSLFIKWEQ